MINLRRILIVSALVAFATITHADVRLSAKGGAPFELKPVRVEDSTAWYDAQTWLGHLSGDVEWLADDQRLTYREGESWSALKTAAPYGMRDGRPVEPMHPPRMIDGRLAVSERFLRESAPAFLGYPLHVERLRSGPLKRIVLDPARGGDDDGARAEPGLVEKELVLSFVTMLAERLEKAGYEVHLTRREDVGLDPARRAAVANYWQADLFLSIQLVGQARPDARGFEIFHPPAPAPGTDPNQWEGAQLGIAPLSQQWAETLRASLGTALSTFDRGVSALSSPLLEAVSCPAAIVVAGNLAWPQEAEFFLDTGKRDDLADAFVEAAHTFFQSQSSTPTNDDSEMTDHEN